MKIVVKRNFEWEAEFGKKIELYKDNSWMNKDNEIKEFILGKGIAGVGQSYFPSNCFNDIKQYLNNNEDLINSIKGQSELSTDLYKEFQEGIIKAGGGRNCRLAVHAMLCALNPDILCNIVDEHKLNDLYWRLKDKQREEAYTQSCEVYQSQVETSKGVRIAGEKTSENNNGIEKPKIETLDIDISHLGNEDFWKKEDDISWYEKSHAMNVFFDGCSSDLPWATLMALQGDDRVKSLAKRLEEQKNIILTGAPGTGKTYLAQKIAAQIILGKPNYSDADKEKIAKQSDFVQFHPSYDYSDFVEGLRPIMEGKNVAFMRMDGKFKAFCKKAASDDHKNKYVFIIDEINRGEMSKIFGELFFAIDPGYRNGGKNKTYVKTQYHQIIEKGMDDESKENYPFKEGFYVPNNVYIIGTMNDIDRSVDSMDFAFRRRFAFIEIKASESEAILYDNDLEYKKFSYNLIDLITRMDSLNKAIVDPQKGGLSDDYQLGGAYFLRIKDAEYNYSRLWNEYIKGVLREYYRGNPEQNKILKKLEDAYNCTLENS